MAEGLRERGGSRRVSDESAQLNPSSSWSSSSFSSGSYKFPFVVHSWFLYLIPYSVTFVIFSFISSLVLDVSDSSACDSKVPIFLYLAIGLSYILFFFLLLLIILPRLPSAWLQNLIFSFYCILALANLLWGSFVLFETSSIQKDWEEKKLSISSLFSSPCGSSLSFKFSVLGLVLLYFFFLLLLVAKIWDCFTFCCLGRRKYDIFYDENGRRMKRKKILMLGMGSLRRKNQEIEEEIRVQKKMGMYVASMQLGDDIEEVKEEEEIKKRKEEQSRIKERWRAEAERRYGGHLPEERANEAPPKVRFNTFAADNLDSDKNTDADEVFSL